MSPTIVRINQSTIDEQKGHQRWRQHPVKLLTLLKLLTLTDYTNYIAFTARIKRAILLIHMIRLHSFTSFEADRETGLNTPQTYMTSRATGMLVNNELPSFGDPLLHNINWFPVQPH